MHYTLKMFNSPQRLGRQNMKNVFTCSMNDLEVCRVTSESPASLICPVQALVYWFDHGLHDI